MTSRHDGGRLPAAYLTSGSSSFHDFLRAHAPEVLPSGRRLPSGASIDAPHGTTIVAITFDGGVLMAGDRRATMGNIIANREMEKVFAADEFSTVGIAGTAGLAIELVRLFQVELEHYEKIEGTSLTFAGKANRLGAMVRGNFGAALQGLVAVPLLAELALLACAVVPLLCMSMLAGERRAGRLALYAGMGLSARALVLGKYLAALAWLLPWLLLVLAMPLSLAGATAPDWGKLAAAALGLALLLSTLAALAIACSAHVGHPALAAVLALVITLALWTLNLGARWAGLEGGALDALAMSTHLQPLLRGVVSSADVAWFVLVGALALALAVRRVDAEKARG